MLHADWWYFNKWMNENRSQGNKERSLWKKKGRKREKQEQQASKINRRKDKMTAMSKTWRKRKMFRMNNNKNKVVKFQIKEKKRTTMVRKRLKEVMRKLMKMMTMMTKKKRMKSSLRMMSLDWWNQFLILTRKSQTNRISWSSGNLRHWRCS